MSTLPFPDSRGGSPAQWRRAAAAVLVAVAMLALLVVSPARAFDPFVTHEVTAQFAMPDGKPLANAKVLVFAPGDLRDPVQTGRTDASGKFVFDADRDGMWSAEARTPDQIARIMIRVGGGAQKTSRLPYFLLFGALGVLVVMAFWYRLLRARARRPMP